MNIDKISESYKESKTLELFSDLAKNNSIAIIYGVVFKEESKASNNLIFVDHLGRVKNRYTKIHPFSFVGEDEYYIKGNNLSIADLDNHKIGLTICYDLRFSEIYDLLAKESDIIVNIANWPRKRVEHWKTLLKARAIENQLFILGVNRTGVDGNGHEYEESSFLFDANGEKILSQEKYEEMSFFTIDKQSTIDFKSNFNTVQDKRYDL